MYEESFKMDYVVDMQGFKQPVNDYILKELAIIPLQGGEPVVFLFSPPFPWNRLTDKYKRENTWLEQYYHGLSWKAGQVPYNLIKSILQEHLGDVKKIYVAGAIQKSWLERFKYNNVINIAEMGYPPLDKIKLATVCPNHNGAYRASCALHNARLIKQFILESSTPLLPTRMEWE